MKTLYPKLLSCIGTLALFSMTAPGALAQCGLLGKPLKPASWMPYNATRPYLQPAAFQNDQGNGPAVVGMWHVIFIANTINGNPIPPPGLMADNAIVVWHNDGTEIMNSNRPAQDGNFCLGVWVQTGNRKYHLNHIPWAGNDPTNAPYGIGNPQDGVQLTEDIILSGDGNSYTGNFTLTQYQANGTVGVTFTGTLRGTRVTPYTPFTDLL